MPFVRSGDADIYWKMEGGAGAPPLILLNSIGTDMDLWDAALPALRNRFALLRIDTRGHGASDAPGGDYSLGQLAADVAAAMDAAGVHHEATVAGVSLGGMIAMTLAVDFPQRVHALALICTSATMDRAAWAARVETVRANGIAGVADLAMGRFLAPTFVAAHRELAEGVRRGLLTMDAAGYAGCAAAIRDMTVATRLAEIRCPTLIVTGRRDLSTPFEGHGDFLLRNIAESRHVALDAAHLAPIEAPDALAAAIIDSFA